MVTCSEIITGSNFEEYSITSKVLNEIVKTISNGGKIILCGNGGSSSMCDHIVGELMKDYKMHRKYNRKMFLIDDYPKLNPAIPAISLCSNTALITAIANDIGYEYIFAQQLIGYGIENDVLIVLSTSGLSENCIHAARIAKKLKIKVIVLSQEGTILKADSDYCIEFKIKESEKQQEMHLMYLHYLCKKIEEKFFLEI